MEFKNELAPYLFHQGTNYMSYEYLGVHRVDGGFVFRVWAPHADSICVIGDFNGWSESNWMQRMTDNGVWELTLSDAVVQIGHRYKYKIFTDGQILEKADPYAIRAEAPPATASVVDLLEEYPWRDAGWLAYRKRKKKSFYSEPINIYELHLGSWKRHEDGSYYSYAELASELAPYVKQMGYTHVELMPIMEHPFDGSWGYQICSYYAPSARFGSPKDFMGFVDSMHEAGIGVILDWVPAHFPKDAHGLYEFDGRPLYEYQGWDRIEHAGWGTRRFDVGRNEVQCFLISNALFWIKHYHVDGLRVDAVASMLYLDYDRGHGEWTPNIYGDHRCLEAIDFFQKLNRALKGQFPDVWMIAEESTAWKNVTSFEDGGLGFDMKWNMGWMNDTLSYAKEDPIFRRHHHEKLNFSMTYAFSERYVLPISHDEVVHGKHSLLDKMPGDYWQKFANTRLFFGYMMTMPGKKLSFMGNEIGQFGEWNFAAELDWFLLEYESHAKLQHYVSELNQLYLQTPSLWQCDDSWDGFVWIDADNRDQSILSYRRIDRRGREVIVVLNFTPIAREDFLLGVPFSGTYEEIFNSDSERFGGSGVCNEGEKKTERLAYGNQPDSLRLRVPPLGMTILRCKRKQAIKA